MATQGQRQNYLFRPTTNDSKNLARYDEQANLWYRAYQSAERRNRPPDYKGVFSAISLILSLVLSIIMLIILSVKQLFRWIKS